MSAWPLVALARVCRKITDGSHNPPSSVENGEFSMLSSRNILDDEINFDKVRYLVREDFELENKRTDVQAGDVLLTIVGTIGRAAVVTDNLRKFALQRSVAVLKPDPTALDSRFLMYFLQSHSARLNAEARGVAQKGLYLGQLGQVRLTLPPLDEQKRIVAILDEAFEGIAKATANAERNVAHARELPEAILDKILTHQIGWRDALLCDVAEFKNGLNFNRASRGETIKIVGVKDFQNGYWVPTENLDSVTIDGVLAQSYELRPGDIITVRSNGARHLVGRCVMANEVPEKTTHSGFTIRIRVGTKDLLPEFLTYLLKRRSTRARLIESGEGANITSLNQKALSAIPVSFPDLQTQVDLLVQIHSAMERCRRLLEIQHAGLAALSELKQTLLHKAFTGRLTSADTLVA